MNRRAQVQLAQSRARVGQRIQPQREYPMVAGCGSFPTQLPAQSDPSLPPAAPAIDPAFLVKPNDILQSHYSPLGVMAPCQLDGSLTTADIFPTAGLMYGGGLRCFNNPNEVMVHSIIGAGAAIALNAGPFDAATYNTLECFCPFDFGCFSRQDPLQVTFSCIGVPSVAPILNFTIFGTTQQSYKACYPAIGPALACPPGYGNGYGNNGYGYSM